MKLLCHRVAVCLVVILSWIELSLVAFHYEKVLFSSPKRNSSQGVFIMDVRPLVLLQLPAGLM